MPRQEAYPRDLIGYGRNLPHARWPDGARDCEATIEAIRDETGVDEDCLLWSIKEYKKTRVRYFTDDWDDWRAPLRQ